MKKLFLALALTGMVGAVSATTLRQDDKTKAKETAVTSKDGKTCTKDSKSCCKKGEKACATKAGATKACCKKGAHEKKSNEGTK